MDLEVASLIATTVSFVITIPLAALARIRQLTHALLIRTAFSLGYILLAIIFVVDAAWRQAFPETLRFTMGLGAGIATGLLISGCILYVYDVASLSRAQRHAHSKR